MNRKFLSSLAIASALTLAACAGGASDAGDSASDSDSGAAAGPRTLLVWVDTVREPACQAYQASVQRCPHAVPSGLHVARWLLGEDSAVVPGTSGVANKRIP